MPMLRRVLRTALFAAVVLLLWTISRSAWAATLEHAPFCDDRGASAIAPPPTIESPTDVLDRVRAASACPASTDDVIGRAFAPGHRAFEAPASNSVPALWRAAPTVMPPFGEDLATHSPTAPSVVELHWRIERPPRG
jgi:hypothetical protein